nr:hypothetical protein [Tanacetum cinerariifolium]
RRQDVPDGEDVDVHTYISMIGSLMYLTSSRPDIMFAVNDVIRLQALVDKKKVVVTEATILETLRLDDAEGVECLPNEEIFVELARMGYEKPSTKLTLVRHVDSPSKFYMYPRFLQLIIRKQVGKGFYRVDTPLFDGMLVKQQVVEEGDTEVHGEEVNASDVAEGDVNAAHGEVPTADEKPSIPFSYTTYSTTTTISRYHFHFPDETMMNDVSNQGRIIAEMDQDVNVVLEDDKEEDESEPAKVQEVVDVVTTAKIITKVVTAASETITAASTTITAPEAQVPTATLIAAPSRRRKTVVIKDPEEESTTSTIIPAETKSKDKGKEILVEEPKPLKKQQQIEQDEKYARELEAELNKNIDWDEAIDHVNKKAKKDNVVKRYQAMKRKPQTEAQARKNMMVYLKNVAGFKMDYFKRMSYDDIRPIFERYFDSNMAFLQKTKEQIKEKESKALKRLNETPAEKAAKQQKLDEEVKELKRHLQIVPNEDDNVYTEATPLARKVPIVDYDIIKLNNKPYYKIIRADDHHEHFELPEMLEDPYVKVALQAPPSLDYIPGPEEPEQAPPSPDYIPGPEHADDEIVTEDQPYAEDASPIAQSPEYVPKSDFEAHLEDDDDEDPEEDPVDYLADGGDDGDNEEESSEDDEDDKDDDMDIEADEEEEHPAPADSVVVASTAADQAPSTEETEPFETDESAATPPPHPAYRMTARISIPSPVPMLAWTDSEIVRLLAMSSLPASPLSPWSSPPP